MSTEVPDDYDAHIKQQILAAFGFASEAELDAAIEEELPGYLAAEAEYKAEQETFRAQIEAWNGWVATYVAHVAERWRAELDAFIRSPLVTQLASILDKACAEFVAFARAIDPTVCHHSPACFCRPAPHPAARDYRRRTKHRNRRRKS